MKGDQMLWWVFSDNGPTHNNHTTGAANGLPFKIEIRALAYAYSRGTLIDNVIYYEYTMVNRSANNYGGFRFALFADIDVGFYSDDYMGFDSTRRMAIGYNARTVDNKYGSSPPITALTILHTPGDAGSVLQPLGSCMYFNNDTSPLGNPTCDTEFNHYMRSRFRDGVHLTNDYAGPNVNTKGRGSGPETNYAFYGDVGKPGAWSACESNNPPGDVRAVLSTDDYDFNAGSTTKVAFALVIADTNHLNGCPLISSFDGIKQVADTAWANYNYTAPPPNLGVGQGAFAHNTLNLYPNPAHDILCIKLGEIAPAGEAFVYDLAGRQMKVTISSGPAGVIVNTASLAPGTYSVVYQTMAGKQAGIFVKQ